MWQTATYRNLYFDAIYSIIAFEGEEIGRFIEQDETDVVCFVDFLSAPQHQAKRLGPAITRALMEQRGARGRGTRVEVPADPLQQTALLVRYTRDSAS